MFETGIRQARLGLAMVRGRRIDPRNVERLIGDALATLAAFGAPGDDVDQLLDGPFADAEARRHFQDRALRRTARRLAARSPYYRSLFSEHGIDAGRLDVDTMAAVPTTVKADLVGRRADFVVEGAKPFLATRTTGTTGRPAEVWLSRYEAELWPALGALSGLLRGEIGPDDCMQINISSRATAAVHQNVAVCRLVGARSRVLGVVPTGESLDSLLDRGPSLLTTYPSYLAQLVAAARRRGVGPADVRLRRIDCGGEVLSAALAAAAAEVFGARVNDTFGMTEVLPVSGRSCSHRHLHHDLNMGFVEVVDLETGGPAAPGRLGTVVVTPYYPYRECMPVFRYDTRDVVRKLADEDLVCELRGVPATSLVLGKADHLVGGLTLRDLVEAIESLPSQPWPARFAAVPEGGRLAVALAGAATGDLAELERRLAAHGVRARVSAAAPSVAPAALRPLRADLVETTFTAGSLPHAWRPVDELRRRPPVPPEAATPALGREEQGGGRPARPAGRSTASSARNLRFRADRREDVT
ncbi:MAG TPA: AMP-binding protein [Acidimicrobiales bacterium]|nr:AMP-binding protein [Acidimicrobiales bacterium]